MNIFEMLYPRFYFDKSKPIRLFEAFSGVGCQAMALKRITDNYELVGFSEIDVHAIKSYQAIHGEVKNYGDITMMGEIPPCDIFTWSFPCTDLSKAGKQKGLSGGTRSGLVYEVLRLLRDTAEYCPFHRHIPKNSKTHSMGKSTDYYQPIPNKKKLPKVLIMENVVDLVQVKFVDAFNEIQRELEELGYTNYNEVLNAKDFEIPQNRERVFMVSILGDEENEHYSFAFPPKQELKLRLKDLLEYEVDEKYYLSEQNLKTLTAESTGKYQRAEAFRFNIKKTMESGVVGALPAGQRTSPLDPYWAEEVKEDSFIAKKYREFYEEKGYIPDIFNPYNKTELGDVAPTITTQSGSTTTSSSILIKEATAKGYAEAHDGDGVYLNRPHQKRGVVQKGMIQTIKTSGDDIGVVLKVDDTDVYSDEFEIIEIDNKAYIRIKGELFRIRKLTPLECWRLMGISDEDFYKAKNAGVSNSQLYKQAGNGIVVNVFEAILREMIR